jgi:hypothetical protein
VESVEKQPLNPLADLGKTTFIVLASIIFAIGLAVCLPYYVASITEILLLNWQTNVTVCVFQS